MGAMKAGFCRGGVLFCALPGIRNGNVRVRVCTYYDAQGIGKLRGNKWILFITRGYVRDTAVRTIYRGIFRLRLITKLAPESGGNGKFPGNFLCWNRKTSGKQPFSALPDFPRIARRAERSRLNSNR